MAPGIQRKIARARPGRKRFLPWPAALLLLASPALSSQRAFAPYARRNEFLLASPGGLGPGLEGYLNPALLSHNEGLETLFSWTDDNGERGRHNDWGLFSGLSRLGFGLIHQKLPGKDLNDYRLALALGDRRHSLGLGYGWASGNQAVGRKKIFILGTLLRPSPHLSLGMSWTSSFSLAAREFAGDLALRPLGSPRLTLFAEGVLANDEAGENLYGSAGAAFALWPGALFTGRFLEDRTLSFGLNLSLGRLGFQNQARFDRERDRERTLYALRWGAYERSVLGALSAPRRSYLELDLFGPVRHRRFALFDRTRTLVDLLVLIGRARDDPAIGGIAINASGMRINPEMAWELRRKLQQFKAAGKGVVVYLDRANLRAYHFASVADRILLDPAGLIALEGFVAGQTYFKGALDKLGIAFEEWRFFEYKSAFESLARRDMSAPDRRQWQALLDDEYALVRAEVGAARGLSPEEFDRLVGEETLFLPAEALARGLVDRLGRWNEVGKLIKELEGAARPLLKPPAYRRPRDRRWGERKRIAIVYALGLTAMDQGIRARRLVGHIDAACGDARIRAVVLRVDSPGGDALAADQVAAALERCKQKKPLVVSQGRVAASGGYWLSMYGDAIVAAPNTITGSIGVIFGWLYNAGFKERLGLSTDHVQVGPHADLGFGATLPLLGLQLPDRNFDPGEKKKGEHLIRALYRDFVAKVARARRTTPERIDSLAQGRVWSGTAALERGLVDRLGGLDDAIALAKEKAGIPRAEKVGLVELPPQSLLNPALFRLRLFGTAAARRDTPLDYLRFRLEHNGQPLLLLPAQYFDAVDFTP